MAKVTSYDVAKRAGVSQSAVSRTFSNGGKVAADTELKSWLPPKHWVINPTY